MSKTSWRRLRPTGAPEAAFRTKARLGLPQALASLGHSGAWAALAGHIGRVFDIGKSQPPWSERVSDDTFRRLCLLMLVGFFGCAARARRGALSLARVDSSGEGMCTAAAMS